MPAIIFDLFGTLIDGRSDELAHEELSKFLAEVHGMAFDPDEHLSLYRRLIEGHDISSADAVWAALVALSKQKGFEIAVSRKDIETIHAEFHGRYALVYEDAEEALKKAKSAVGKLGLVSDADATVAGAILDALGFRKYFDVVVTSGELGIKKPDPKLFVEAARRLRVSTRECAVVGDSWKDVEGGKKAGMKVVLVMRAGQQSWSTVYEPDDCASNLIEAVQKALNILAD